MTYYDISCFRHHDKQTSPSQVVYRLKYDDDKNIPANETLENNELAKKILLANKGNKNVDNALDGYFTRFEVMKYESYS